MGSTLNNNCNEADVIRKMDRKVFRETIIKNVATTRIFAKAIFGVDRLSQSQKNELFALFKENGIKATEDNVMSILEAITKRASSYE